MSCGRCHGLMVVDHFLDMEDDCGHLWLRAWRCVSCGDVAGPGMRRQTHHTFWARLRERFAQHVRRPEVVPIGV